MPFKHAVKIRNYKSFGQQEQGFDNICTINIIIGKNNSEKNSLVDLVGYLVNIDEKFLDKGRDNETTEVIINDIIDKDHIDKAFVGAHGVSGGGIPGVSHSDYGLILTGEKVKYILRKKKEQFSLEKRPENDAEKYIGRLHSELPSHCKAQNSFALLLKGTLYQKELITQRPNC